MYSSPCEYSFDGEVQFKLQGPDSSATDTGCLTLGTGGGDLFKAGGLDIIEVRGRDIGGAPTQLFANINGRNSYYSYALSRVEVLNKRTGDRTTFKLGGVLYTWNWWTEITALPRVDYFITTSTSNTSKGFDGQVYITITGDDGSTQEAQLTPPWDGASLFQASATDSFYINAVDVGQLQSIDLRVANTAKKWNLDFVDVVNTSSGCKGTFEYGNAVSSAAKATISKAIRRTDYDVTVTTADVLGAGTDGRVYLTLSGDSGATDEVLVSSDPEAFKRGNAFSFSFSGVDVGDNRSLKVRLTDPDGGSLHSGWNLASIDVLNKTTGLKGTFNYFDWLPLSGGTITLSEAMCIQALNKYTVTVSTSDQREADFEGQAFITINGWSGSTTELPLTEAGRSSAAFRRGQTLTFEVLSTDVGWLSYISVRMIPSATDPDWALDTITVTNSSNSDTSTFTYGNRLNTDNTSVTIYKTVPLADYSVQVCDDRHHSLKSRNSYSISFVQL